MRYSVLERKSITTRQLPPQHSNDTEGSQSSITAESLKATDYHNFTPAGILHLQRTIGNTAVQRLIELRRFNATAKVVQRMPTSTAMVAAAGTPKRNINIRIVKKNRGETYKKILETLDQYHSLIAEQVHPTVMGIGGQRIKFFLKINQLINYCDTYLTAHKATSRRAREIASLREQASLERVVIRTRATYLQNQARANTSQPNTLPDPRPTWASLIPKEMATRTINLGVRGDKKTGQDKGQLNSVTAYNLKGGRKGFFKADKATMDPDAIDPETPEFGLIQSAEADLGYGVLGIPKNNPQFANRSVAMYRLDQLLNANVIARTEFAMKRSGIITKGGFGTIMEAASGKKLLDLDIAGQVVNNDQQKAQAAQGGMAKLSLEDPVFQKALSKLNILDALAFQIDRHNGNFFVDIDNQGNVKDVKGIDHDLSFPEKDFDPTKNKGGESHLSGVPRFIDKEIAEMVLALQDDDLRAILAGLIPQTAIDKTVDRLHLLKTYIQSAKAAGRLVDNLNSWNAQTAAAEEPIGTGKTGENIGYLGKLRSLIK
ncbi:MAG: hypothetical protein J0I20_32155 [Chloroflexi bacterium]|nr:hypothetical protein [Chloroflexota bacterium]OJV93143.1 MAG: hypothetical protein BGO39_14575 [Chloroflexi bacterium 54-19]